MAVRGFDGVDDWIRCVGPGTHPGPDAFTMLLLVKPTAINFRYPFALINTTDLSLQVIAFNGINSLACVNMFGGASCLAVPLDNTHWQLIAVTRAAQFAIPRFHRAIPGAAWARANGDGVTGGPSGVCDVVEFGSANGNNPQEMRLALAALWSRALSDAEVDSITGDSAQVTAVSPVSLWEFNQANVATPVVDLVGDADQFGINGTTVVTGDDPSWTFSPAPVTPSGGARNWGFAEDSNKLGMN